MGKLLYIDDSDIYSDDEDFKKLELKPDSQYRGNTFFKNFTLNPMFSLRDSAGTNLPLEISLYADFKKCENMCLKSHLEFTLKAEIPLIPLNDSKNINDRIISNSETPNDPSAFVTIDLKDGYSLHLNNFYKLNLYKDKEKTLPFNILTRVNVNCYLIDEDLNTWH